MSTPTVFLFDIDGTILNGGGAGRRAMEAAFTKMVGDVEPIRQVRFAGMTDRGIVRSGLQKAEAFEDEGLIDAVLDEYLDLLPAEIEAATDYGVHEGLEQALELTESLSAAAVGLGTGNVELGARAKLEPLGFNPRFGFGGFGNDAEDRAALLRIGADRGAQRLGVSLQSCRVVVIGDTPRDIDAAARIGASCLAVATGTYPIEELQAANPTLAVPRLDVPEALDLLRGASGRPGRE